MQVSISWLTQVFLSDYYKTLAETRSLRILGNNSNAFSCHFHKTAFFRNIFLLLGIKAQKALMFQWIVYTLQCYEVTSNTNHPGTLITALQLQVFTLLQFSISKSFGQIHKCITKWENPSLIFCYVIKQQKQNNVIL